MESPTDVRKGAVIQVDLKDVVGLQRTWVLDEARRTRELDWQRMARERAAEQADGANDARRAGAGRAGRRSVGIAFSARARRRHA